MKGATHAGCVARVGHEVLQAAKVLPCALGVGPMGVLMFHRGMFLDVLGVLSFFQGVFGGSPNFKTRPYLEDPHIIREGDWRLLKWHIGGSKYLLWIPRIPSLTSPSSKLPASRVPSPGGCTIGVVVWGVLRYGPYGLAQGVLGLHRAEEHFPLLPATTLVRRSRRV